MNWVSVKDALPDYEVEVLTTDGKYCNVGQRYATGKHGECWRLASEEDDDNKERQITVTHWTELPPLPNAHSAGASSNGD